MKIKKEYVFFILVILVLIISANILYIKNDNRSQAKPKGKEKEITRFLQAYGNFFAPEGEKYFLNLYYFYSNKDELQSQIERIEFIDAKDIEITSFKIIDVTNIENYNIRTIPIEVIFHKKGRYQLNKINITDQAGASHLFDIGKLNITVENKSSDQDIRLGDKYPAIRNNFNSYEFSLDNVTNSDITITDIDFRDTNLKYNFDKKFIKANSNLRDEFKFDFKEKQYSYYILRPKIEYQIDGKTKYFYPTLTYYDINSIKKEVLEKDKLR
ncbi:hypothetical protein JHL18_24805 [Clostridium sp. YIM B02505]|uniref:Uncharacterized protein n=1 Tax=Clostridium yunnanense TaxID=2800325 RepID=A0ABS1EWS6_9CLOT|nr:hypothetical protein [Clostridium yunnanense]MBK1813844.1 hypothetical protein [Clostridium yunnanense]